LEEKVKFHPTPGIREKIFKKHPDGTIEQRTRSGSYRTTKMEKLSEDTQSKIYALSLVESGAWVPGVGGTETIKNPPAVFFYIELL
jgi:hypothetical protein